MYYLLGVGAGGKICLRFYSLIWFPPKADPETRIYVKVVYLGRQFWEAQGGSEGMRKCNTEERKAKCVAG